MQKVSILGGPPVTLATLPTNIHGASWGEDDKIIVGTRAGGLFRVPAGGGEAEVLTTPDAEQGEISHSRPFVVPDRQAVLFVVQKRTASATELDLAVLRLTQNRRFTRRSDVGIFPKCHSV